MSYTMYYRVVSIEHLDKHKRYCLVETGIDEPDAHVVIMMDGWPAPGDRLVDGDETLEVLCADYNHNTDTFDVTIINA